MEERTVSPFNSRARLESTGTSRKLRDLPESLLFSVLAQVSETGGGFTHALVCRKWADVSMEAQRRALVREDARVAESDLLNELSDFPNLRELQLKRNSALRLSDRFFLGIGGTCPHLESISILDESSSKTAEFSTEGLRGMISSLPGLKSIVLKAESGRDWEVPDSVSSLLCLEALALGTVFPTQSTLSFQPSSLRIPPSTRELSLCNLDNWHMAVEEGGLQGLRLLSIEDTVTEEIPEALWTSCPLRSVTIKANNCRHLSASVSKLTTLRQLNLVLHSVTVLPDCFSTLQLLTQLRLSLNNVEALPDSLWSLTSLKHLCLDCFRLRSINSGVGRLQKLTSLDVYSNQRFSFPSSLCGHSALRKMGLCLPKVQPDCELHARVLTVADITLNEETDLSKFLRGCPSLSSLSLRYVKDASSLLGDTGLSPSLQYLMIWGTYDLQRSLPDSFGRYSNLETLEFVSCGGIRELPASIGECGRLTMLKIDQCSHLRNLPFRLDSPGNLATLRIEECPQLQRLPKSVGQLSSLKLLELENLINMRSIPHSLGALHQLNTLMVSNCSRLKCLPESVGQLALLTTLSVWNCPLVKQLPASMSQLLSLSVLELVGLSALQSLPVGLEKITTLHSLTVKECASLQELLSELGRLKNLRDVVIADCHTLRHLPPSIVDLLHLKRLHLETLPSLSGIPQQIGQLSSLRDLLIHNMSLLTSLPGSMTRLTGLAELVITDCHSLAWVPELLENLSEISEESRLGLQELMETGALRGVQQRRSRHSRRTREGDAELSAGGIT